MRLAPEAGLAGHDPRGHFACGDLGLCLRGPQWRCFAAGWWRPRAPCPAIFVLYGTRRRMLGGGYGIRTKRSRRIARLRGRGPDCALCPGDLVPYGRPRRILRETDLPVTRWSAGASPIKGQVDDFAGNVGVAPDSTGSSLSPRVDPSRDRSMRAATVSRREEGLLRWTWTAAGFGATRSTLPSGRGAEPFSAPGNNWPQDFPIVDRIPRPSGAFRWPCPMRQP